MSPASPPAHEAFHVYDTTLRDGAQQEGLAFSVTDKLAVARHLDDLGVGFIEGGWPGANPKDTEFFRRAGSELDLRYAQLAAFGATRRPGAKAADDPLVAALRDSGAPVVTLVAKSHDRHVELALRTTLHENLAMVRDTVRHLRAEGRRVFLDAEHFFDGYLSNPAYAVEVLRAAAEEGADVVVLCDTNGGRLPDEVADVVHAVAEATGARLGIHCHNDTGCAVAHAVSELANVPPYSRQPYVGASAFAHKAGLHASAVRVDPMLYQHANPEAVGNDMRMLVSEMAGRASIELKGRELGYDLAGDQALLSRVTERVKDLEARGYTFEAADASFELLLRQEVTGAPVDLFEVESWRVIVDARGDGSAVAEATVKVRAGGERIVAVGEGNGPVNALDHALRTALAQAYPELAKLQLIDYRVRIVDAAHGTDAVTRVLVETSDGETSWETVGVHPNIIEASWEALLDAVTF